MADNCPYWKAGSPTDSWVPAKGNTGKCAIPGQNVARCSYPKSNYDNCAVYKTFGRKSPPRR